MIVPDKVKFLYFMIMQNVSFNLSTVSKMDLLSLFIQSCDEAQWCFLQSNSCVQAEDMQCPPFVRKMRPTEDPKYRITKYDLRCHLIVLVSSPIPQREMNQNID